MSYITLSNGILESTYQLHVHVHVQAVRGENIKILVANNHFFAVFVKLPVLKTKT